LSIVSQLRRSGPTDEELARAQQRHAWQLRDALDAPEELSGFLGHGELMGHPSSLSERQAKLDAVTRERAIEVAARWFTPERLNVVAVGLQSKAAQRKLAELVQRFS
jgi:predicted Zn-dependent peptidase